MKLLPIISLLLTFAGSAPAADKEEGWNPDTTFPPLSPAEAIKTIEIPKGYRLECIASEPMVEGRASFAFDGNGALYVCEWRTYMQDEFATKQHDPVSRVVKLVDTNGDGIMDRRTVFIDNVVLPRTVLPLHGRVLVTLTGSNSVWAYFDDNKDGVSDRHEGGPNGGNIEHQNSGMVWNLDNTICTNDFRFRYAGGKLIVGKHAVGRISQWGLARDDAGLLHPDAMRPLASRSSETLITFCAASFSTTTRGGSGHVRPSSSEWMATRRAAPSSAAPP